MTVKITKIIKTCHPLQTDKIEFHPDKLSSVTYTLSLGQKHFLVYIIVLSVELTFLKKNSLDF